VTVPKGGSPKHPSRNCVGYGAITERLLLPVEASLVPEVSDAELGELLSDGYTHVWHPSSGLIAVEPDDQLTIADLVSLGPSRTRRWDRAQPGVVISRRLVSMEPVQALTLEEMLEEGRGDIGTNSADTSELPPSPREPKTGPINSASRQGKRFLAGIVHWFTQRVPESGDKRTWINSLEEWAERQKSNIQSGLNASRHKELERLMHLLENDPDRGLRFALPMGGDAHRGLGTPGGQLTEHDTNFQLGGLGGGQAADYWDVASDYQYQLTARYRELANREVQLGRHRRAAYIFAELLGDLDAAAGALTDGCHWREAAVLYKKRLDRPLDAARCLEQGGLWTEAIGLYDELGEHEQAGDIHTRLAQVDQAHLQYRKAVDLRRADDDLLSAARLLEHKLDAIDEAVMELSSGWPDATQADQCVRQVFQIFSRAGRHDEATQWINRFRQDPVPKRNRLPLVKLLTDTATGYPDPKVRDRAADCTRVVVSNQLTSATNPEAHRFLSALGRLVPEDRLLQRDCHRYSGQRVSSATNRKPVPKQRSKQPRLIHTIRLPGNDVRWSKVTTSGRMIFVAGKRQDELVLVRSSWQEVDRPLKSWAIEPHLAESPILLTVHPLNDDHVLVHVIGGPLLAKQHVFDPSADCAKATTAGPIRGMSPGVLAAVRTVDHSSRLLESRDGFLTHVGIGPNGEQVSTQTTQLSENDHPIVTPIPIHERVGNLYIGLGSNLHFFRQGKSSEIIAFDAPIQSLVGSAPSTRTRIAMTFAQGAKVFWDDVRYGTPVSFATDMPYPVVCFHRGGYLIAASEGRCEVYRAHDGHAQLEAELDVAGMKPIAVLSGPRTDQFGLVTETGEILVYEMP